MLAQQTTVLLLFLPKLSYIFVHHFNQNL